MNEYSISAEDAAERLGKQGKSLRAWLRAHRPEGAIQIPPQKNGRWWLTEKLVATLEPGEVPSSAVSQEGSASVTERTQERDDSDEMTVGGTQVTSSAADTQSTDGDIRALEWSEWVPFHAVMTLAPRTPGVYMMRLSEEPERGPVYIGMAGERKGNGIRGRLAIYFSGKGAASGLGEHAFDRALADPAWVEERLVEAHEGRSMRATKAARSAIDHLGLEVRWTCVPTRAEALHVESELVQEYKQQLWNR